MRHRIRERAEVDYQVERSNAAWPDHRARTLVTAGIIAWLEPKSVLDPACGDGSLVLMADQLLPIDRAVLADVSSPSTDALAERVHEMAVEFGHESKKTRWRVWCEDAGRALDILAQDDVRFDVLVLTEFLEHVPDPDWILRRGRDVAEWVVCSSPLIETPDGDNGNPEHLWAFDNQGYNDMLVGAGWTPKVRQNLMFRDYPYTFQIWAAKR